MRMTSRITSATLILVSTLMIACTSNKQSEPGDQNTDSLAIVAQPAVLYEYGLPVDSFEIYEDKVKRNEHLSEILVRYDVDYSEIHEIVKRSKDVFNVKRIRSGNDYKVFCTPDTANKLCYLIYHKSPIEYIVFDFQDSLKVYEGHKEVVVRVRNASGVITSSLYETMLENDLRPLLALELSEVYAWQVDFFRVQKGDRFKVIFEEKYVDDAFIGYGRILGAYFKHFDKEFYGIYFKQGEKHDYFDEEGNSLRKAFLKAPLKYSRISSRYSRRRFHPILKHYRPHLGVDYAARRGTAVLSVGEGIVVEAGYKSGNGNYVKVRHNSMYTTGYLHLSKRAKGIKKGIMVSQGQIIGYVGSTGLATGPHLCYRFFKHGEQVNPLTVEIPPSKPVDEEYKEAYVEKRDEMMKELEELEFGEEAKAKAEAEAEAEVGR